MITTSFSKVKISEKQYLLPTVDIRVWMVKVCEPHLYHIMNCRRLTWNSKKKLHFEDTTPISSPIVTLRQLVLPSVRS